MLPAGLSTETASIGPMSARIEAIDILRGLALFGILTINLDTEFRVTFFEQFLPAPVSTSPLDNAIAAFLKLAIEFKAFSVFSFLFGMGLAMQFEHLAWKSDRLRLLVRRLLALLAFGLVHLALIWNGDILTEYALAGFVVLPFLFTSSGVLAVSTCAALLFYSALPWLPISFGFPDRAWLVAHVASAREIYGHGGFSSILAFRISEIPYIAPLHAYVFSRTIALMLFGALVWRSGVIAGAPRHGKLLGGTAILLVGLGVFFTLLVRKFFEPIGIGLAGTAATLAETLLPVVLAIGYAATVIWFVSCTRYRWLLAWAAPIGRMAFTNYITQSILLGVLFYGYGFGWMGELGTAAGFAVVVAVYSAQVFLSRVWLQSQLFGPLEWLWRTIMYGKVQPFYLGRALPSAKMIE